MKSNKFFGRSTISFLLVIVLLFSLFISACGKNPPKTSSESTTDGKTKETTSGTESDTNATTKGTDSNKDTETGEDVETSMIKIDRITINNTTLPLGIDSTPHFGWTVSGNKMSNAQTAYQVKVFSTREKAEKGQADVWDSGKVNSKNSTSIKYEGKKLNSMSTYYFTVKVWDKYGAETESEITEFRTGIFTGEKWPAEWIGAKRNTTTYDLSSAKWIWYSGKNNGTTADGGLAAETVSIRKTFTLNPQKTLQKAVFVFTADDYGTLYVNGTTALVIQNITDIWKTGNIVDITEVLTEGTNVIAARISNATVGYAGFVGKLYITYTDGSSETIVTDNTWKLLKSAPANWNKVDFDDSSWNAPDQYVSYGASPWSNNVVISNEGDRAAVLLRKEFTAKGKNIVEATVYMSGVGYSILTINGKLADDSLLDPCNTQYNQTVLYRTFDVTELILSGKPNAIAVELGNGFFYEQGGVWNWANAAWKDTPKLLFVMQIRYEDGTVEKIVSDETWRATTDGPTRFNSIYYGEYYDARYEKTGWDKAGYNDSAWSNAVKATGPKGKLECQLQEPVRRTHEFKPTSVKKLFDGSYVVYCPEMVAGWIKLTIKGAKKGDTITITYSEKLNPNGSVQKLGGKDGQNSSWWPETYIMTDKFTSNGAEIEIFEPKFSYKGFRYIQIYNYPGELTIDDIVIYRTANDVPVTGSFETSNELINKLHKMMVTTMLNNLQGKPTDTPVWEKNGWLGDFNVALQTFNFNFNMSLMTENFVEIMESCFEQYGLIPQMVPTANWGVSNHYVWNSVYVFAVYEMYKTYGTLHYVEEQYESMKKYAVNVSNDIKNNGWVCPDGQLADWVSPMGTNPNAQYNESPSEGSGIVGTAMIYMMYDRLAEMAEILGKTTDAKLFRLYMTNIYNAFNKKFYNKTAKIYETTVWNQIGTRTKYRQTSNILPLVAGLVPDEYKDAVIANLISDIKKKGNHLDTGVIGTKFILPLLSDLGYEELAYLITTQTTYPSWGFMLEQGSTSLWEMWETTSRSLGHYFLGTYDEWFFSHLAGVCNINNGYEAFTIKPHVIGDLTYVTCKLDTVRGELESSWTKATDGTVTMKVTVPFGSTATVIIPIQNPSSVTVNSKTVTETTLTLGSGTYEIVCKK